MVTQGPPESVLESPDTSPNGLNAPSPSREEVCKTTSALILIYSPIFHPKTIRLLPASQVRGHSLSISLLWPLCLQSNEATPFYSSKVLSPYFYLALVNRGWVSQQHFYTTLLVIKTDSKE